MQQFGLTRLNPHFHHVLFFCGTSGGILRSGSFNTNSDVSMCSDDLCQANLVQMCNCT